ncbi:MAG: sigma-70 family RNA polymerase sigma factor [Flavobacteriaceae bacterium]
MTELTAQWELVSAIHSNNELVLKQLYQNNYKKVETYILKNNGTMPQAKDIYQEAFIAVWQNIKEGKFTPHNESALQGYLYQIAKNKWTDELRSSRFKKTSSIESFHQFSENEEESTSPFSEEKEQNSALVEQAFRSMGTECKELLSKFYFEKKSMRDIAAFFGIEEASARNKKYRCIQQLKELVISPK